MSGHVVKQCPKASFCKIEGCQSKHSSFLHPVTKKHDSKNKSREEHEKSKGSDETNGRSSYIKGKDNLNTPKGATSLAIVPVKVKVPGRERMVKTYAFLDNGSNTTFCTENLMEQLQTRGKDTTLSLTTLGIENYETKTSVASPSQRLRRAKSHRITYGIFQKAIARDDRQQSRPKRNESVATSTRN